MGIVRKLCAFGLGRQTQVQLTFNYYFVHTGRGCRSNIRHVDGLEGTSEVGVRFQGSLNWELVQFSWRQRIRKVRGRYAGRCGALRDLCEIARELVFLDDEKMVRVCLDQAEVFESLHKDADPGTCRADHF